MTATRWVNIGTGMNTECEHGDHAACSGRRHFHNCPCSCHHGRTIAGQCATYGCDCHEQEGGHGLPFSHKHRIRCRIHRGSAVTAN